MGVAAIPGAERPLRSRPSLRLLRERRREFRGLEQGELPESVAVVAGAGVLGVACRLVFVEVGFGRPPLRPVAGPAGQPDPAARYGAGRVRA